MKRKLLAASVIAATSCPALAGFSLEGSPPVQSTSRGSMGAYSPAETRGAASFSQSTAPMAPRQERYKDAELLVDLAYTSVTQNGSDGGATQVDGFGEDLPFTDAMALIVPTGWHIYRAPALDKKDIPSNISFAGGKSWPNVLRGVGDRYALQFHIDWYDRTVMIKKGLSTAQGKIRVIAEPTNGITSKPGTAAVAGVTAPLQSSPPNKGSIIVSAPGGGAVPATPSAPSQTPASAVATSAASGSAATPLAASREVLIYSTAALKRAAAC